MSLKITMISHCCLLIELDGKVILTDPWMTEPLYWGKLYHRFGLGMTVAELPPLDLIVASHGHDDHLDPATLRQLDRSIPVAVCHKAAPKVRKLGFTDVRPMTAGDRLTLDGITVNACYGKHPGGLVTYVIEGAGTSVFFAGDTAYHPRLADIGDQFQHLTVSLLPVSGGRMLFGAYHLHMNPTESAQLAAALGTRVVIPVHYHFELRGVPRFMGKSMDVSHTADELQRIAPELCPDVEVVTLAVGQHWSSAG